MNKIKFLTTSMLINTLRIAAQLSIAFLLVSCSSGPDLKTKCTATDWNKKGFEAGVKGESAKNILKTQKKCAKEGYQVSVVDYKEGWLKGIEKYCSTGNAFEIGLEGKKANSQNCPVELRPKFDANYKRAENYLDNKSKIEEKTEQISDLRSEINSLESERQKLITEQSEIEAKADKLTSKAVKYKIR